MVVRMVREDEPTITNLIPLLFFQDEFAKRERNWKWVEKEEVVQTVYKNSLLVSFKATSFRLKMKKVLILAVDLKLQEMCCYFSTTWKLDLI